MADFAVRTVFGAQDKLSPAFKRMGNEADKFGRRGAGAMGRINNAANSLLGTFRGLLPIFGVAAIANYANKAIELASALTEVQNVVDVTFGDGAKQINEWSKTAITQFGLSELQAKKFTGSLGAMMKSSGLASDDVLKFSTNLTGLAGDFASFYNLPIEEAFEKIRSGISGETEPLKQLGINMSVANMEAFALTKGITKQWKAMSQAEQTQLRYAFLMKASSDAQGDFNKTLSTSYANQKRVLGVKFDQALAEMATKILPDLTSELQKVNKIMDRIDWERVGKWAVFIVKWGFRLAVAFTAYKIALAGVWGYQKIMLASSWLKYLWMMRAAIFKAVTMTKAWAVAQKAVNFIMAMNPIGLVIIAVAALGVAIYDLYKNWDFYMIRIQIKMKEWELGFRAVKLQAFELLNTMGMLSDSKFELSKIEFQITAIQKKLLENRAGEIAPNSSEVKGRQASTVVNVNNATPGTTAEVTPRRGATVNMDRVGANP